MGIYDYRLKDAFKKALKVNPVLKEYNNTYDIKDFVFYDMYDFEHSNGKSIFACTANNVYGEKCILVNQKFQYDCIEALISILSHELTHILPKPTLDEEIKATTLEAETWIKIKPQEYKYTDLTKRLDKIAYLYHNGKIEDFVKNNYKNLNA